MGGSMPQPSVPRRWPGVAAHCRFFWIVMAAVVCLGALAYGQKSGTSPVRSLLGTQQKPAEPAPAPAASPTPAPAVPLSQAIPLPDVAARSEELKRMLRDTLDQLPTTEQLDAVKGTLEERDEELQSKLEGVNSMLVTTPSTLEIREEENYWKVKQKETAATRQQLLDWANTAQSAIQQLQSQGPQWQATLEENKSTPDLGPTLESIQHAVDDLQRLKTQAQNELRLVVNMQVRAANQDQLALDVLHRLEKARANLDNRMFERDSLPLWRASERREIGENTDVFLTANARLLGIRAFIGEVKGALGSVIILLLISLFAANRLYRATRKIQPENPEEQLVLTIASHWVALGLLPPLLSCYLLAPLAPLQLIGLVILISFFPILTLLPSFLEPRFRLLLYCVAGVYTINAVVAWVALSPAHKREVQFGTNLIIFLLFAFLVRPSRLVHIEPEGRAYGLRVFGIRLAVAVLGLSLAANLFGYVKLAQFFGLLCLYSTFIAISMLTGVRVFTLLLLHGLDAPVAEQLAVVRQHRDAIARWGPRVLKWGATLVWLIATIDLMGLSDWATDRIRDILEFHIAGSSASITLGGVLGFFLILLVGYSISSAIRFLLREELLGRFHLSRGLPELIASTLHYLLLLLVFFFAVNAGGIELNKFTVLTGALGVGVGFGLQNIVNNFISGLILQFERPIHIGDVLDVDGTTGKVSRIGIRSSTVLTFQGAEVIIPNANFISSKVINWTLSASLRRVELPVGVAYGSDCKVVTQLLNQAATTHESVLTSPAPAVYFKEFADSSLNFELQFWVMQESNTVKVKSEVALAVMQSFDDAGIEIPFPQRDLRLRAVDTGAAAALLAPEASQRSFVAADDDEPEPRTLPDPADTRMRGQK